MKSGWGAYCKDGFVLPPSAKKLEEVIDQLTYDPDKIVPGQRIFNCCRHDFHEADRNFKWLETYEWYYNTFRGPTEAQAEMALLFMKQHPDFVMVVGGVDSSAYAKLVEKMPAAFTTTEIDDRLVDDLVRCEKVIEERRHFIAGEKEHRPDNLDGWDQKRVVESINWLATRVKEATIDTNA